MPAKPSIPISNNKFLISFWSALNVMNSWTPCSGSDFSQWFLYSRRVSPRGQSHFRAKFSVAAKNCIVEQSGDNFVWNSIFFCRRLISCIFSKIWPRTLNVIKLHQKYYTTHCSDASDWTQKMVKDGEKLKECCAPCCKEMYSNSFFCFI